MPQKSKNFNLEYLTRGSSYSSAIDSKRFNTLDYNLESYVGIVGAGIINGWEIEPISGLNIQIIPGCGVINGYAVESPYSYKQRSSMVIGDREVEELHDLLDPITNAPIVYPYLTNVQKSNYVYVVSSYDPTHEFPENIENCFVKTSVPISLTLTDNSVNYIYAYYSSNPYPKASDFPSTLAIAPVDGNFTSYDDYMAAFHAYMLQINAINIYEWRANVENHYSAVSFVVSTSIKNSNKYILLGRAFTSNGKIDNIDLSGVKNLYYMEAAIKKAAKNITAHVHGGTGYFDPPKIKLQTDIRNASIGSYNPSNSEASFNVLESQLTGLTLGHQHTFYINNAKSGFTVDKIGDGFDHYHNIINNTVNSSVSNNYQVNGHNHTLPNEDPSSLWSASSPFVVYLNDIAIGDQDSSNIVADSDTKTLSVTGILGPSLRTYSTTFDMVVGVDSNNVNIIDTYSLKYSTFNVLSFMLYMINNFNLRYKSILKADGSNNPFLFTNSNGKVVYGFQDLYNQSLIAQDLLKNTDETFLFTSNAAKNITIKLEDSSGLLTGNYNVKIEFIENTEVSGILSPENVIYINATKIQLGEFEVARIPQISHVGRMKLNALPAKYPLTSNDGTSYYVLPGISDSSLGHYHNFKLDKTNSGITSGVFIGTDQVLYETGLTGTEYFISHIHGVTDSIIASAGSAGLLGWQNDINSTNSNSSSHIHNMIFPTNGDEKNIYSIIEANDGTIYSGTSNKIMVIPNGEAYLYVVNNIEYYMVGSDLWELLLRAKEYYEKDVSQILVVTEEIYGSQIPKAYAALVNHNDSYLLHGYVDPERGEDLVLIKKLVYSELPNCQYEYVTNTKDLNDIGKNDTIKDILYYSGASGELIPFETMYSKKDNIPWITIFKPFKVYVIDKQIDTPIWSMDIAKVTNSSSQSVIISGTDILAQNYDLSTDFYKKWTVPNAPSYLGSMRKIYSDSLGAVWIIASGGLFVARSYNAIENITQPGNSNGIKDIVEGNSGTIYVAGYDGIYETTDNGATWTRIFYNVNGCSQIIRDYAKDKTDTVLSHYHTLSVNRVGDGNLSESIGAVTSHSHSVLSWNILTTATPSSHVHSIIATLYCITNLTGYIYKSEDNGATWVKIGNVPYQEHGEIFVNNDRIFSSLGDGLYELSGTEEWKKIFDKIIYSYSYGYAFDKVLLGGRDEIYVTYDFLEFETLITMDGSPNSALYLENSEKSFNYYSNRDNSFRFKDYLSSKDSSFALVDFSKWIIPGGGWSDSIPYDIYINKRIALSTKKSIDHRELYGYNFIVDNKNGIIDFGVSSDIVNDISVGEYSFNVIDASKFNIGDKILIKSNYDGGYGNILGGGLIPDELFIDTANPVAYTPEQARKIKDYELGKREFSKGAFAYAYITNIIGNQIYIGSSFENPILKPSIATKITTLDSDTEITVNVYESYLSNIGTFTHEELDDSLSKVYNGKPYEFNNAFLSILLQLTQGLKYATPDIDYKYKNYNYYDFNYSWTENDPLLPYIGDFIDLYSCDINNFLMFENTFFTKGATKINKIIFGKRTFANIILGATDIGVFYANVEAGLEGNWFYSTLQTPVFDLIQFGEQIFACTNEGTYLTTDIESWTLESASAITFQSTKASLRWANQVSIEIPAHTATFSNIDYPNNAGSIISSSNIYTSLIADKKIEIVNAGNISGTYTVQKIIAPNSILTYEEFPIGVDTAYSNVTMKMGTWWGDAQDIYPDHPNVTNTLIIGGANSIAFRPNPTKDFWQQSTLPDNLYDFYVSSFGILSNGSVLASTISSKKTGITNNILRCDGSGNKWTTFKTFSEITGSINDFSKTPSSHTKILIKYTNSLIYMDGNECGQKISIFSKSNSNVSIYDGSVIWNEEKDGSDYIYLFSDELFKLITTRRNIDLNEEFTFKIYPIKINSIVQLSSNDIVYGTDNGIYSDERTTLVNTSIAGYITDVGYGGIIEKIDIQGNIVSASQNFNNGKAIFNVSVSENIGKNDLTGYILYITDLNMILPLQIIGNSNTLVNGEMTIEIDGAFIPAYSNYTGKKITISKGTSSKIYLTFNTTVSNNQFLGGTAVCVSSENYGKTYDIVGNTTGYIEVTETRSIDSPDGTAIQVQTGIIPSSTSLPSLSSEVVVGQKIKILDAEGRIILFMSYSENPPIKNQIAGYKTNISNSIAEDSSGINVVVHSNEFNIVLLDQIKGINVSPLSVFNIGDLIAFNSDGAAFNPLIIFNNKITTLNSSHYHDVSIIGSKIYGEIESFSNISSSYVDINVANTIGFNTPILLGSSTILTDAEIIFLNPEDQSQIIKSEIVSYTDTSIRVRIKDSYSWNFIEEDYFKISETWLWQIDARYYGKTENIYYNDFESINVYIEETLDVGKSNVKVTSTTGMIIGDKVAIIDETLQTETNYILSVIDDNLIILENPSSHMYEKINNPSLKVLSNSFTNNHTHEIKNCQIETLNIIDYIPFGYPNYHSHESLPALSTVSKVIEKNGGVSAIGSSSKIFSTGDIYGNWGFVKDLNTFLENSDTVSGIIDIILDSNNKYVVGTGNGYIATEEYGGTIVPLEKPIL